MTTKNQPSTKIMFADEPITEEAEKETPSKKKKEAVETTSDVHQGSPLVSLPSQGKLGYPSTISYRDILVKDEEVLSMATPDNFARTMNSVLKAICNNADFFDQVSVHDRDYLLVWLWANNYNPIKEVEITCSNPNCQEKHTHKVDLTNLEVDNIPEQYKGQLKVPLSLGEEGAHVRVHHNTVSDENAVEEFLERTTKTDPKTGQKKQDHSFEHLLLISSIDVGINIPLDRKIKWVGENMTGKEMGYVKKFHQFFKFGVQDTVDYTCPSCGEVTTGALPFRIDDMLWPELPNDDDEFLQLMQDS